MSKPNVTSSDRTTYETSYLPGEWSGQLKAFELDTSTGAPTTTSPWSSPAMEQLDLRTSSSRRIGTHDGTDGVAFKAGSGGLQGTALSQLQLPSGTDNAAAVIEYLRGDRSGETSTPPAFKLRSHLLGAIIHSEPFLVRPPDRAYSDTGYASFRTANPSRSRMLYVGANDGMLHAFDAQTGAEEWAYVPGLLLPRIKNLADPNAPFQATVDGFITVGDADLGRTQDGTGTDWRTMLVSGLGRGGKGFFALDITTPTAATDSAVADKVLWEFQSASGSTDAANVGLVSVLVEGVENILHHAGQAQAAEGSVLVGRTEESYRIVLVDRVELATAALLQHRIEMLNAMDEVALKEHYLMLLANESRTAKGGAGLGLLTMARRTRRPMRVHVSANGGGYAVFCLELAVARGD